MDSAKGVIGSSKQMYCASFIVTNVTVQIHAGHNVSGLHLCSAHCLQGWNMNWNVIAISRTPMLTILPYMGYVAFQARANI